MDQKTYLKDRVDEQINWYSQKSKFNQTRFKVLKTLVIVLSVSIPFLVGLITDENDALKIIVGISGVLIAGFEGIMALNKYQDLWIQYRLTAEMLEREKIMFVTQIGPYDNNSTAFKQFVKQAESIMGAENQAWLESHKKEDSSDK